jgi:hypothetical protein
MAWCLVKNGDIIYLTLIGKQIRGPFAKFVDSPYHSEAELCGDAVTVSFSKHSPWQAMHFLQRSTHFSKTCGRPLITSKFLASGTPFHGWKSPEIAWGEIWTVCWVLYWGSTDPLLPSRTQNSVQISPHAISGLFQPWKGSSKAINFEVMPRKVLQKRDRHRTSTKFSLGVIRWVHKLFKRPSYIHCILAVQLYIRQKWSL